MKTRDTLIQKLTALGVLANNPNATAAEVEAASDEVQTASAEHVQYLEDNPPELDTGTKPEPTQPGVNAAAEGTTTGDELDNGGGKPLTLAPEALAAGDLPAEGTNDGAPNPDAQVAVGTEGTAPQPNP